MGVRCKRINCWRKRSSNTRPWRSRGWGWWINSCSFSKWLTKRMQTSSNWDFNHSRRRRVRSMLISCISMNITIWLWTRAKKWVTSHKRFFKRKRLIYRTNWIKTCTWSMLNQKWLYLRSSLFSNNKFNNNNNNNNNKNNNNHNNNNKNKNWRRMTSLLLFSLQNSQYKIQIR